MKPHVAGSYLLGYNSWRETCGVERMKDFPQRLRELRKEHGMLQRDLAKKLNLSRVAITQYEQGKRFPEWETLEKIADIFGVSVDYLLGRTDKKDISFTGETLAAHRTDDPTQDLPPEARRSLEEFKEYILRKYGKKGKEERKEE